jgi:hypothetical protein
MEPVTPQRLREPVTPAPVVRLYYSLKRFIPKRFRLALRKAHALRVLASCQDRWPICESAGETPVGWPGWPGHRRFAFVLTHDVETQRGMDRVKQLAELEMEYGFRSSFNFVPEGEYTVSAELRDWLTSRGFEVGVHDLHHDGNLYASKRSFGRKAKRVNDYLREWGAVGFRSGFMLHNLDWAHELNVLYEASTFDTDPFEPQPDGADTIFPFWVSALANDAAGNQARGGRDGYIELPYTLPQDSTLFVHLGQRTIDLWRKKLAWIAEKRGMSLLLVHPDYTSFGDSAIDGSEFPVQLYREFLLHVESQYSGQYWHALPREVAHYCHGFRPAHPMTGDDVARVSLVSVEETGRA